MNSMNIKKMILAAIFTALTAIGAFIKIPLPMVPIVMQTFFVLLAGIILGSKWGMISQLAYVTIGLIGFPIFTQGGGLGYVMQPTFGFLLSFIPAAFIVGWIVEHRKIKDLKTMLIASFVGIFVIYAIGVPYLAIIFKTVLVKDNAIWLAFYSGFLLVIPGDIIKAVLVSVLSVKLYPITEKS